MPQEYFVYILTNKNNNVLYCGVTSDLQYRMKQHKHNRYGGFTTKYNVHKLVYYEVFQTIQQAIAAEKKIKNWRREWKRSLITEYNPRWEELDI